jgi:hypothetical protein
MTLKRTKWVPFRQVVAEVKMLLRNQNIKTDDVCDAFV